MAAGENNTPKHRAEKPPEAHSVLCILFFRKGNSGGGSPNEEEQAFMSLKHVKKMCTLPPEIH